MDGRPPPALGAVVYAPLYACKPVACGEQPPTPRAYLRSCHCKYAPSSIQWCCLAQGSRRLADTELTDERARARARLTTPTSASAPRAPTAGLPPAAPRASSPSSGYISVCVCVCVRACVCVCTCMRACVHECLLACLRSCLCSQSYLSGKPVFPNLRTRVGG